MVESHITVIVTTSFAIAASAGCRPADEPSIDQSAAPVATTHFDPEPIRVTLDDMPEPYDTESARQSPRVVPIPDDPTLTAPEGFEVNVFASGLDRPRWLALTPDGDVLVTETYNTRILRLRDTNGDGAADDVSTFADEANGLDLPFGMAFRELNDADNADTFEFYLGNTGEVRRYSWQRGQERINGRGERIVDLPGRGYHQHWTRNVIVSPDESSLFVSVGSESNVDIEPLPRASVQRIDLTADDLSLETFAYGLRNPVGLDFHPVTGDLYTTVNERDGLGDDLVPDYLAHIEEGQFYGWPYAYLAPRFIDPRHADSSGASVKPDLVARTVTPEVLFQSHSAALGLAFYDAETPTFPDRYRHGAYVAFRGSWNRDRGTGYKIVFVPFDPETHRPLGHYEDFITGFLLDPTGPTVWGRPVGALVLPDGSLLFTEEPNGRIYRVSYSGG